VVRDLQQFFTVSIGKLITLDDAGNPILLLLDEGTINLSAPRELSASSKRTIAERKDNTCLSCFAIVTTFFPKTVMPFWFKNVGNPFYDNLSDPIRIG
jgi:hypothetical protein